MGREAALTVEQLAAEAGLPTSTIRMYQTKGLLHPPRRRGRTARYDGTHVERLGLVHRLQQRGFSLPAIAELIAARDLGARVGDVLGLDGAGGPDDWVPVRVSALRAAIPPGDLRPSLMLRAVRLDLVRWRRGRPYTRRWVMDAGLRMATLRVPSSEVLAAFERLRSTTTTIAGDFTALFEQHLWPALADQAGHDDQLDRVRSMLLELTETAQAVVAGALRDAIRDAADGFAARHHLLPDHGRAAWVDHAPPVLAERLSDAHRDEVPGEDEIQRYFDSPDGDDQPEPTTVDSPQG
ncbi:MerR family transcriptional regulator [Actinokineospora cianjurensis]|uniref:MerR-like DNA binding protein n=1 Tax=Actinokineospora cianjurensis TaxID=585224 RepID=A0A421BCU0_9PSEU|nr:MerR family transcriptional regulator [Actinokineospora cianjurensis]RLK62146.1 MerR-like DNA binding protein [Actinokineospora cianjurensis]